MGILLAKKQARAFQGHERHEADLEHDEHLPSVTFADYGDMRFLHLGTPAVQGSMKLSKPFDIHLEYVQRMMAWLLFTELNQVQHMRAMQLGLGAASLTKFCHHHLGMHTTAVELNPQVIDTCRRWFSLPKDDDRLSVVVSDAGQPHAKHNGKEK
jgi:spermidine synthase